ncbi:Vasohibin-2 [Myotis davidii]|uniref:Vasohibin-2 n=1 Tax=Myotis davidii TaxID=225400 RepID=L5LAR0_MYODS|nr:Vasohibin-2 [Myotis davidii]
MRNVVKILFHEAEGLQSEPLRRPALPEKKVADLSTLNEVGYQIRI